MRPRWRARRPISRPRSSRTRRPRRSAMSTASARSCSTSRPAAIRSAAARFVRSVRRTPRGPARRCESSVPICPSRCSQPSTRRSSRTRRADFQTQRRWKRRSPGSCRKAAVSQECGPRPGGWESARSSSSRGPGSCGSVRPATPVGAVGPCRSPPVSKGPAASVRFPRTRCSRVPAGPRPTAASCPMSMSGGTWPSMRLRPASAGRSPGTVPHKSQPATPKRRALRQTGRSCSTSGTRAKQRSRLTRRPRCRPRSGRFRSVAASHASCGAMPGTTSCS